MRRIGLVRGISIATVSAVVAVLAAAGEGAGATCDVNPGAGTPIRCDRWCDRFCTNASKESISTINVPNSVV